MSPYRRQARVLVGVLLSRSFADIGDGHCTRGLLPARMGGFVAGRVSTLNCDCDEREPVKRVLSVGQCVPDHGAISRLLSENFDVAVDAADTASEAIESARTTGYDLVLVNRLLDRDGTEGLEIIRELKADDQTRAIPVMLITNYPEHDETAVKLGAEGGFGKASLGDAATRQKLAAWLE